MISCFFFVSNSVTPQGNGVNKFILSFSAQMLMKARLAGAQKGHGLLKKKADALQMRFRQILSKIIEVSCCGVPIDFIRPFIHLITYIHSVLFLID